MMRGAFKAKYYFLFILLLVITGVSAQIKCKIEHYSTEDGLSHDGVMTMLKDREGFMWFGTWDGINRFDGHNFITYKTRPGDSSVLKDNRIEHIYEDKAGYLWLTVYNKQVYRFDKKTEKFQSLTDIFHDPKLGNMAFSRIVIATNGYVWLISKDQGIYCLSGLTTTRPKVTWYAAVGAAKFKIASNNVRFVNEDAQHHIWIGTQAGINCFEPDAAGIYQPLKLNTGIANQLDFLSFAETDTRVWMGTAQGQLVVYQKRFNQFSVKKVSNAAINAVLATRNKQVVYLATSQAELITVNALNQQTQTALMPGGQAFLAIYEDNAGRLWLEPAQHGVVKYEPQKRLFKYFFQKNDATYITPAESYKVMEDNAKRVWVSMKSGGFGYYTPGDDTINYFYNEPGAENHLFSNLVNWTYMDPAGILWLTTNDRGINKVIFQRDDFNLNVPVKNALNKSDNEIRALFNDSQNRLWVAAKSGMLYIYDANGTRAADLFINQPAGGLGFIYSIMQDHNGAIWIGTKGNGLFKAEQVGNKYKLLHYTANENDPYSLSSDLIYSVIEDKKGRIWVGTYGNGLNLLNYKNGQLQFLNRKNTFKNYPSAAFSKIRDLQQDVNGNVWIGTTEGLLIIDYGKGQPADFKFNITRKIPGNATSLGNNNVQYIFRDSKNRMWVCTSGGGLNLALSTNWLQGLTFKVYTTTNGLPNDYILNCLEDNNGNLWMATENGLSKFNLEKGVFKNYDSYDGLPRKGFSEASCLKLPNGNLLFGCISGFVAFNPDALSDHKVQANMAFTNLQINNQDVVAQNNNSGLKYNIDNTDHIALKYNQNIISLDFTVLDYRSGNKQVYAYRLTGFDTVWHSTKNVHRATYTNLPIGNYIFEVKSLNNDLYTNIPAKQVTIAILPPPWLSWWAYLIYLLLAAVLIEVVRRTAFTMLKLRNRISVEQRLADLKVSFFTNISHELRTPLTLILNPIEEIHKKEKLSAEGNEYIDVVRKNANRMVRFINQLLDLRKVQSGKATLNISRIEVLTFIRNIGDYFTEVAHEKQITLKIASNVTELHAWFDSEKIDIVIYNILANAFKFTTKGKSITVEVSRDDEAGSFSIQVIDGGVGVPANQLNEIFELYYEGNKGPGNYLKGTGIGLALSKELVALHHGRISANNNTEGGLTVKVDLKLGRDYFTSKDNVNMINPPETAIVNEILIPEPELAIAPPPVTPENIEAPLVLLVEDNLDLRKFLAMQLRSYYRIAEAENGEEGLTQAIALIPDLILSDVMMPKMDGIQMLDKLKNNVATSHIPVVLLTAKYSVENQIEGLKYGADYYITKPFNNEFLLASIANLLRQRKNIFDLLVAGKKTIDLSPGQVVITSKDEAFLKQIIKIVEQSMVDPNYNIDSVAEAIGMGRTTFYRKFRSLTNLAPVEFVREMRLKRARQLLDAGEGSVSEIAYAVGFNSAGYFSTCFKEKYQVSPSEYLKNKELAKT